MVKGHNGVSLYSIAMPVKLSNFPGAMVDWIIKRRDERINRLEVIWRVGRAAGAYLHFPLFQLQLQHHSHP